MAVALVLLVLSLLLHGAAAAADTAAGDAAATSKSSLRSRGGTSDKVSGSVRDSLARARSI